MDWRTIRWPGATDAALAVAFAVVAEVEMRVSGQNIMPGTVPVGVDSVLVLLPVAPLAWRRIAPFPATVVAAGAMTGLGLAHGTVCLFGGLLRSLLLLYAAAAWTRAPYDRLVAVVPVALAAPMDLYNPDFRVPTDLVFALVVSLAAWLAGQGVRRWQHQSQALAEALASVEQGRADRERLAVAEERARIARELHDVVAHGMSVMVMQAGAARLGLRDRPDRSEEAAEAFARIEGLGRGALLEMRRLLGILRRDEAEALAPPPRLTALPELLDEFAAAGLEVVHRVVGEPRELPDAQDLSAYRIIREALTNALRHGAGGPVTLVVAWEADRLCLTLTNQVAGTPATERGGHGLIGIRERVALFGGRCTTVVREGRYETSVELPYDRSDVEASAEPAAGTGGGTAP
jgi:signal transduction histidine kinase